MTPREWPMIALAVVAAFIALVLLSSAAEAQSPQQCGQREKILEILEVKYGETRRSIGLTAQGAVVETFASEDTGTWTVSVTFPQGRMCLIATGQAFEAVQAVEKIEGKPL